MTTRRERTRVAYFFFFPFFNIRTAVLFHSKLNDWLLGIWCQAAINLAVISRCFHWVLLWPQLQKPHPPRKKKSCKAYINVQGHFYSYIERRRRITGPSTTYSYTYTTSRHPVFSYLPSIVFRKQQRKAFYLSRVLYSTSTPSII